MAIHIRLPRTEFYGALTTVQNVTAKKSTIAILSNVLLETTEDGLQLTATDLQVGMKTTINGEVLESGSITIPAKKLLEIVRESASDTITLEEKENNWITIEAGSSNYKLAGMNSDEYPAFPEYDATGLTELPAELVKDIIDKVYHSVANEGESQFNLTGALLEKIEDDEHTALRIVSSDGHRLSLMERRVTEDLTNLQLDKKTLIPKKGLQEIRKCCELSERIAFSIEPKQAVLQTGDTTLLILLLNGDFPEYNNIIAAIQRDSFIEVDRIQLLHSMKRTSLFTEDQFNVVNINIDSHNITLSSQSADIGSATDSIAIKYSGEPFSIFFNGRYFIEALQVLDCEKIRIHISSEKSPCFITAEDEPGYISVIMPMKI